MSLYRNILSRAWQITWRSKYLWFFGLFAALLGNGGELEVIFRGFSGDMSQGLFPALRRFAETGIFSKQAIANIGQLVLEDPISLFFVLAVFLILVILICFLIWLVIVSQAALVNNSANIIAGKNHDFKQGIEAGMKKFWPVLGLNLLIKIIIYLVFVLLSLPVIFSIGQSSFIKANLLFVISFLIFIPVGIVLAFIIKYAIAYVVIKGSQFLEAIKLGCQLFVKNWLISLEMAFILFFINFLVGFCLLLLFLVLAVPFLFLALIFAQSALYFNFWVIIVLALILYLSIIILVGAGLAAFQISSWTGLFIELVSRGGMSKIVRIFDKK